MPGLKYSRQREAILQFLMTRKDHPTADVVYANIRAFGRRGRSFRCGYLSSLSFCV